MLTGHAFIWATTREEWDSLTPDEQWQQYQDASKQMTQYAKWYISSIPEIRRSKPTWLDKIFGRQFHVEIIPPKRVAMKTVH